MRKQELDNWIENGGELPDELTENEKNYLKGLGWTIRKTWWQYNGKKSSKSYYLNGKKHGKYEGWCDNGQKEVESYYLNGKEHGKHEGWYPNGQKEVESYYLNGKEHGKYEFWHYNGQKWIEGCRNHGKEHGVYKWWSEDGTLDRHEEYAYGVFLRNFLKEETK